MNPGAPLRHLSAPLFPECHDEKQSRSERRARLTDALHLLAQRKKRESIKSGRNQQTTKNGISAGDLSGFTPRQTAHPLKITGLQLGTLNWQLK